MRTTAAVSIAAAAAALLAGCSASVEVGGSGYDRAKAQRLVARTVGRQVGAQVDHVTCPADLELRTGARFTCTVVGTDGTRGPAFGRFTDDKGNVHVSAPLLHIREAEQAISGRFVARYGGQVLVRCPEIVRVTAGRTFRCTATKGSQRARVEVELTDARGHFTFHTL